MSIHSAQIRDIETGQYPADAAYGFLLSFVNDPADRLAIERILGPVIERGAKKSLRRQLRANSAPRDDRGRFLARHTADALPF